MTVVIAHTTNVAPTTAMSLSLPFAMLMQYILLMYYSAFSFFMPMLDKAAAETNLKRYRNLNF